MGKSYVPNVDVNVERKVVVKKSYEPLTIQHFTCLIFFFLKAVYRKCPAFYYSSDTQSVVLKWAVALSHGKWLDF